VNIETGERKVVARRRTGYYSPPSDSWHRTRRAAVAAARKALAGTGEACSISQVVRTRSGDLCRTIVCGVSDGHM
jgi:hypothetical protein